MIQSKSQDEVLRPAVPADRSLTGRLTAWGIEHIDIIFCILRNVWPIPSFGKFAMVTRADDVREVMSLSEIFVNPYNEKLDVIMGGHPFFLGMTETEAYTRDTTNMRMVMRREDIELRLKRATLEVADRFVSHSGGELEIVDFVRSITFEVLCDYFGTPSPSTEDLRVWATRLFEFQFADHSNDPTLRAEVDIYAPKLRSHVDSLIAARRQQSPRDDVMGRCLCLQASGAPGMDDETIRTNLIGFIVGGLPQPPMVVPQAMEQLLQRPDALASAQDAARQDDDTRLSSLVFEAMRFDPLTPGLLRIAAEDYIVARGTWRARKIRKGMTIVAALRSAMHDGRRVRRPEKFIAERPVYEYMHFGYGLHTCFGFYLNNALLPLMLKPLLKRKNLKRTVGSDGHLSKRGIFAERLVVTFDRLG